jgi:hypothetical protein
MPSLAAHAFGRALAKQSHAEAPAPAVLERVSAPGRLSPRRAARHQGEGGALVIAVVGFERRFGRASVAGAMVRTSLLLSLIAVDGCSEDRLDSQPVVPYDAGNGMAVSRAGTSGSTDGMAGTAGTPAGGRAGAPGVLTDAGWYLTDLLNLPERSDGQIPEPDEGWDAIDADACWLENFVEPIGAICSEGSVCVEPRLCGPRCVCVAERYQCEYPDCAFQCPAEPPEWNSRFCHPDLGGGCVYQRGCDYYDCICLAYQFGVNWSCAFTDICASSTE